MRTLVTGIASLLLGSCQPAVYLNVFNATEDTITIVKPQYRRTLTIAIPPHQAADLPLGYEPGTEIVIRDSCHTWTYSPRSLFPPSSVFQHYSITMRAYSKIDSRGRIYLLAPPSDHSGPKETTQPQGFPVVPQKSNRIDNLVWRLSEKKPVSRNAAQQKQLTAIGAKDSKGRAIGGYCIVNTLGDTQSKGRFVAGFKEGLWTFWDSHGTRTGEIHYHENVASGEFRLFYSALEYPSAAGRLKTVGRASSGHVVGEHIGYDIDGTIMSRAVFSLTGAVTASVGTVQRAQSLREADQQLFLGLDQSIRDALH